MVNALIRAIREENVAVVSDLIRAGCDVNARNNNGNTMLHLAARMNNPIIIRMLLTAGADANAKGAEGKSPLEWALALGHRTAVAVLENAPTEMKGHRR